MVGWGRVSTTTPAAASAAQASVTRRRGPGGVAARAQARATASGPRNSKVTASPRPMRSIAVYSDTFMAANTAASPSTGHHCCRVNARSCGLPTASSTTPATHWRTATTPTGPITGKASAPTAAPVWLDSALPSISATPVAREPVAGCSAAPAESRCRIHGPSMRWRGHPQNASTVGSIR